MRAPDLAGCIKLKTIELTLHFGCNAFGIDLEKVLNPMLSSLAKGPRKHLQRITLKGSVLEGLDTHFKHSWVQLWLENLEDIMVQLHEQCGLEEVRFELDDVAGRQQLANENTAAVLEALPMLVSLGILHVVTQ